MAEVNLHSRARPAETVVLASAWVTKWQIDRDLHRDAAKLGPGPRRCWRRWSASPTTRKG